MLKNYIIIAIRNLVRNKTNAFINILGLATGIACFILIGLYVIDELSFDRFHSKSDSIYRLVNKYDFGGVGEESSSCPFPLAPTLLKEYPDLIENSVRLFDNQMVTTLVEYNGIKNYEDDFYWADSNFFEIFDWKFIKGNPEDALKEPFSILLTESTAKKYFGDENPMHRIITVEEKLKLKVTGILEDPPLQSHIKFGFITSMSSVRYMYKGQYPDTWVWNPCWSYILLKEGVNPNDLEKQFPTFINNYFFDAQKENISILLQKLTDIHLYSHLDYEMQTNGNILYVYILALIAVFMLLIACINFTNLATAISVSRAREISVKKVHGASRKQLIFQFLSEAILTSFIALILSLAMVEIILPAFNNFTDKDLKPDFLFQPIIIAGLLLTGLSTGILSGIYPAFMLSAYEPIKILRGKFGSGARKSYIRKVLVILQFTISIALTVCTLTAYDQLIKLRNADLGFEKENILLITAGNGPLRYKFEKLKTALIQYPDIISITATDYVIGIDHNTHEYRTDGVPETSWQFYPSLIVRDDFLETFDIEIVAGRGYRNNDTNDATSAILINEAMVKHMGWKSNEEALGKKFNSHRGKENVVGVFKGFNAKSLHESPTPFVLDLKEYDEEIMVYTKYMAIRFKNNDMAAMLNFMENQWNEIIIDRPFEYVFLTDELNNLYKGEDKLGILAGIFCILIIFIASIGLYGLIAYLTEQKTKEIGIRKVMGASVTDIILLLTREFIWLILMATILAWVSAWFAMDAWLNTFAQRVELNYFYFNLAAGVAIIVAIGIVSLKARKASRKNPADTIKYE